MRSDYLPLVLVLGIVLFCTAAASAQEPPAAATTYTITVQEDGSALWQIEYRTPLPTEGDLAAFGNYTGELASVYLPQLRELMERSAADAAIAAGRPMAVSNLTGNAMVQNSPTGRYGIVVYSFSWSGFAEPDTTLAIGDAFTGGLYLARDSTLVVRYPPGWTVVRTEPAPDQERDGLVWYGLRSFAPGEPRVTLERSGFPVLPAAVILVLVLGAVAGFVVIRNRKKESSAGPGDPEDPAEEPAPPLSGEEAAGLEDRILRLLAASGGEQHQAEIVKALGLPKSTVSSALNSLHEKSRILKIRKGRENIIRLVQDQKPE